MFVVDLIACQKLIEMASNVMGVHYLLNSLLECKALRLDVSDGGVDPSGL